MLYLFPHLIDRKNINNTGKETGSERLSVFPDTKRTGICMCLTDPKLHVIFIVSGCFCQIESRGWGGNKFGGIWRKIIIRNFQTKWISGTVMRLLPGPSLVKVSGILHLVTVSYSAPFVEKDLLWKKKSAQLNIVLSDAADSLLGGEGG